MQGPPLNLYRHMINMRRPLLALCNQLTSREQPVTSDRDVHFSAKQIRFVPSTLKCPGLNVSCGSILPSSITAVTPILELNALSTTIYRSDCPELVNNLIFNQPSDTI